MRLHKFVAKHGFVVACQEIGSEPAGSGIRDLDRYRFASAGPAWYSGRGRAADVLFEAGRESNHRGWNAYHLRLRRFRDQQGLVDSIEEIRIPLRTSGQALQQITDRSFLQCLVAMGRNQWATQAIDTHRPI
ncbi:MAG: hypothetical protein JW829_20745 [Pirellulales bacterium]|nr:hypothetical protein [Pirellulales bacterium]